MAADKALIAGAAKVAGAQAKVDYATTKAFTDLGEDILENSQKVKADMEEAQNELNDLYDKDLSALAIKQSQGDLVEAIFLLRA